MSFNQKGETKYYDLNSDENQWKQVINKLFKLLK